MGCSSSQQRLVKPQTVNHLPNNPGVLKITIISISSVQQNQNFSNSKIHLKLEHQIKSQKIAYNQFNEAVFQSNFTFLINKIKPLYSRRIELSITHQNMIGQETTTCQGFFEIDSIIAMQNDKSQFQSKLIKNNKNIAQVTIIAQFCKVKVEQLHLIFEQSHFNQLSISNNQNVWLEVTAGQQVNKTQICKAKQAQKWDSQILAFQVFTLIDQINFKAMSDQKEIGSINLPLIEILKSQKQHLNFQLSLFNSAHQIVGQFILVVIKGDLSNEPVVPKSQIKPIIQIDQRYSNIKNPYAGQI